MDGRCEGEAGRRRASAGSMLVCNGAYALAVYLGFFDGWKWLAWAVTGFTLLMLACYVAVLVSVESRRKFIGYAYPMPVWVLHLFDATMIAALASREVYFTAAIYGVSALVMPAIETDLWRYSGARN